MSCASGVQKKYPLIRTDTRWYCADSEMDGQPMKMVTLIVVPYYGQEGSVVVTLTNGLTFLMKTNLAEIPSGLGAHTVTVKIGDEEYVRHFRVLECK